MIWGKLPALFVSCDQAHKISKCPALTLSKIHYNLAFNIHLNKQKYFFQVSNMSRTSARSNAVPYLHCPALTLSRTDVVPHWHLQISFNFKDKIYLGVNICVTHSRKIILTELPAFFYLLNRHTSFQNVPHWQNFQNVKSCSIWLFFLLGKLMRLVLIGLLTPTPNFLLNMDDFVAWTPITNSSRQKYKNVSAGHLSFLDITWINVIF